MLYCLCIHLHYIVSYCYIWLNAFRHTNAILERLLASLITPALLIKHAVAKLLI